MTRRDRKALVLAYETLRGGWRGAHDSDWAYALDCGGPVSIAVLCAANDSGRHINARLGRARLALAIRAILRADSGDVGPRIGDYLCDVCGVPVLTRECSHYEGGPCLPRLRSVRRMVCAFVPLWQAAGAR